MRAEEVYNIAIYLPEKELERLYTLLEKKVCKRQNKHCKPIKKKLITDEEARRYVLRTVFKIDV
jgi:L-rhamnose mutarotase